ncbi:MAG: radical SAM protein [Clostridiales bacterium]|jgi:oxygen-independent coproporphyrinogen-3 oxidase|nr:radical SAM protein [Clostridiales bacterium]
MYRLVTDAPGQEAELLDLYKQFYPADKAASAPDIRHRFARVCGGWQNEIGIDGRKYAYFYAVDARAADDALLAKRLEKRAAKLALYRSLADFSGLALPWGSLTGIRPTKLAYELLSEGIRPEALADTLCERYDVSPEKAALTARIVRAQAGYLTQDETRYNLYLHVPFCTTKCRYCSFISETADRAAALIPGYVELLRRETAAALSLIEKKGGRLFSVYVGGGTPTALSAGQLDAVLGEIPLSGIECTVEAGRPDTITQEKLAVLSARGVSRVCVNPQTFHDDTLIGMGRGHTVADFYRAYELARRFGFSLNLDLIAGLRGETAADFLHSLSCAAALAPENLTIHTLSRKRGAGLYG